MRAARVFPIFFLFYLVAVCSGQGFDFGMSIANATGITGDPDVTFTQRDKASLWFKAEMGIYSLSVQSSYTFDLERPYFFDLDRFNFTRNGRLTFNLGRFYFSDFSGYVLSHTLDGGRARILFPLFTLSAASGYTGLIQKPVTMITMSKSDLSDIEDESIKLGPPRLVGLVEIDFTELPFRQSATVSALIQQDLRKKATYASEGARVHTQYFGLGLKGPIIPSLYYNSFFYLGTGKTYPDAAILSYMTGVGARYFLEEFLYSKIEINLLYSSGDRDYEDFYEGNTAGKSKQFLPISRPGLGLIFSPQMSNISFAELSYSIKPLSGARSPLLQNIQALLRGTLIFRSTRGSISESGIDPDSNALYLGTEVDAIINFRPISDLGIILSGGIFIPDRASFTKDATDLNYLVRLELSTSF